MEWISALLQKSSGFMPHGHCYLWMPALVWLNVISDVLIFLAYTGISCSLIWLIQTNQGMPFKKVFFLFSTFVFACGLTHLMEVVNVWWAQFLISGFLKLFTAGISLATFLILPTYFPKVRDLFQKMVVAAKLSSLGEMAGGIAHEINNPLTIIQGKSEQLLRAARSEAFDKEILITELTKIQKTSENISKIIQGLLSFARNNEAEGKELVSIQGILDNALVICAERFKVAGIEIRKSILANMNILCREIQITQVLINLLNNSFDAIEHLRDRWVEISVEVVDTHIVIRFTDSGLGIPQDIAVKIMDPFFTSKGIGKGTGLGLSIAKGLVESNGGELFYDAKSKNTSFVVIFPNPQKRDPLSI